MIKQFNIPILYLVFNRLDLVKKTFPEIQKIEPKQLFIGADGPRSKEEKVKTDEVRKYILDNINWKCDVKTLFRNKNLGINLACYNAINWFFKNVEKGIILEDDNLPDQSFFRYCRELLEKYKGNPRIMSICGLNQLKKTKIKESYYFSKNFGVWGWATWRSKWQKRDLFSFEYEKSEKDKSFNKIIKNPIERIIFRRKFKNNLVGTIKGWDTSFLFLHFKHKGICIRPKNNLIENIGFQEGSTNTSKNFIDNKFLSVKRSKLKFPLIHPKIVEINKLLCTKELRNEVQRILLKRLFVFLHIIKYDYSY